MSCASSAFQRFLATLLSVLLLAGFGLSQQPEKKSKAPNEGRAGKAASTATPQASPAAAESTGAAASDEEEAKGPWHGLTWRLVGPFRGGRVLAVTGVIGDPHIYYFGGVAGGVWKSTDGGVTWRPMTDKVKDMSPSIGAIAVAPSDPNVIYAGTGEACIRGNIVGGNGVYKSIDAGKTWSYGGLRDTQAIGRIIVNPKNADIAFVAALGHPFGPNPERGIFRTTDGGKSWSKVLYKDENSGGIDLSFDPNNANVIFAALWQARRSPWDMRPSGRHYGTHRRGGGLQLHTRMGAHRERERRPFPLRRRR